MPLWASWLKDFDILNIFHDELKIEKMTKFEILIATNGLILINYVITVLPIVYLVHPSLLFVKADHCYFVQHRITQLRIITLLIATSSGTDCIYSGSGQTVLLLLLTQCWLNSLISPIIGVWQII